MWKTGNLIEMYDLSHFKYVTVNNNNSQYSRYVLTFSSWNEAGSICGKPFFFSAKACLP